MKRAACLLGMIAALSIAGHGDLARAEEPAASEISVEAVPVLGAPGSIAWGWNEVLVRIQNNGQKPARGEVNVVSQRFGSKDAQTFRASAPFAAAAGAGVHVRVPVQVAPYVDLTVEVTGEGGAQLSSTRLSAYQPGGVTLVEVAEASKIRGVLNESAIAPSYAAPGLSSTRGSTPPSLSIVSPRFDPATGDPMLPDRAALYATADAVLFRSDVLTRLGGAELDALAGFVMSGGTLAIVLARPEDIRHPTLTAFAGGPITRQGVSAPALKPLLLPGMGGPGLGGSGSRTIPFAKQPSPEVGETLAGFAGGNLHGSFCGNTAAYGLGEVHMLAFDPTRKPAVDDPWAQARMVELAKRAFDRRAIQIFRPGSEPDPPEYAKVRQQLDPNQSSRWAIGVAALLLCIYAVFAGPVNFSLASKKGKPLRALRHLPIYAAVTFALIVAIGIAAKGFTGRARRLTLVEAGAGMTKGMARRFRGFFASRAKDLTVRTSDGSSVVSTAVLAESADRKDHLIVDRDGARLVDVAALPWQTVVIREDGFADLGEGISLVQEGDTDLAIINRSGRNLRSAFVRRPDGTIVYAARIKDGERLLASAATSITSLPDGSYWKSQVDSGVRAGSIDIHHLNASALGPLLRDDAPGLADAWLALEDAANDLVDWFPDNVPTLIAQLDGGEGKSQDSGLRLESDRMLVRVVGFGGKP
ncbi:MAG: hypothetical protein U0359_23515 [Byssovorax sp.]